MGDIKIIAKFLYCGEICCSNEMVATQIYTNLQELFGFPATNFQFDGTILKSEIQLEDNYSPNDSYVELENCEEIGENNIDIVEHEIKVEDSSTNEVQIA